MITKLTLAIEHEQDNDSAGIAYAEGVYYVLRERSQYLSNEYCYVYRRVPVGQHERLSGPLDGLAPAIALVERLMKEDAARPKPEAA